MNTKSSKLVGASVLSAIAASLCCLTPVLALISGASGAASAFSWMEPFRPYLISVTVLVLAFAWYQLLKPKTQKEIDCACEEDEKNHFIQTKTFLGIVTVFAGLMLVFPYYSQIFYPNTNKEVVYVTVSNTNEVEYNIKGMTCTGCEVHIESEVNKLDGIIEVKADYKNANTIVKFDETKVSSDKIKVAILNTGYKIVNSDKEMDTNRNISFYQVGLVCNAVPSIGCGSRSKPVLLELDNQNEIKEARLNKEGTAIKIIWQDNVDVKSKKIIAEMVFSNNKIKANLQSEVQIASTTWLNRKDVDKLSQEEASIIAKQLLDSYRSKSELTTKQEERLKADIENQFYNFFLNYESLDQLADTNEYKKIMLNIIELSKSYIEKSNIPNIDSLLKSCYGHSEKCNKSSCCLPKKELQ